MTENKCPSLYLHVPFCASFCYYCDFKRRIYQPETADRWLDAIETELRAADINTDLETIYIGGGTPSCLSCAQLNRLLDMLEPYAAGVKEFTVECNPETVTRETIDVLCAHHVNRISIGLQTAKPSLLKAVNRRHTADDVKRLVAQFRSCGISNISLDLMYGLPHQTMEDLNDSIAFAHSCSPNHLSLYSLTVEPGSVFGKTGVQPADPDLEADMYDLLCERLKALGYEHYEISNFARDGAYSMHNCCVWEYRDFYGIGFGACGKDAKGRYDHAESLPLYLDDPTQRIYTVLTKAEQMFETVMMGLRLKDGIDESRFYALYGRMIENVYPRTVESLCSAGLLQRQDGHLSCTDNGWPILNTILVQFMEEAEL